MQKYIQEYENISASGSVTDQLSQDWDKFFNDYSRYICSYGYDVVNKDTAHQVYLKGLNGNVQLFY